MERAEALRTRLHHALDVILDGHVADGGQRLPACLLDERDGLVGRALVDVAHDDAGAFPSEEDGGLAAHPHSGAGDQRNLALEPHAHAMPSSPLSP